MREVQVPGGWEVVKQILRKGATCRRVQGAPYRPPPTPDLPMESVPRPAICPHRIRLHRSIEHTWWKSSMEKGSDKVYICLFRYASTSEWLELTHSLSVDSFLLAYWRFVRCRGLQVTLLSDNAKKFQVCIQWYKEDHTINRSYAILNWQSLSLSKPLGGGGFGKAWLKQWNNPWRKQWDTLHKNYDEQQSACMYIHVCLWWWRVHFHSTYAISSNYWQTNYYYTK